MRKQHREGVFQTPPVSVASDTDALQYERFALASARKAAQRLQALLKENRNDQDRDDVHDFDHRIDGRAGGVLVGIADRVAGHRSLMSERAFTTEVAFLDVFLG